jgi:hypothetical protein
VIGAGSRPVGVGGLLVAVALFDQPARLLLIAAPCTLLAASIQLAALRAADQDPAADSWVRGRERSRR